MTPDEPTSPEAGTGRIGAGEDDVEPVDGRADELDGDDPEADVPRQLPTVTAVVVAHDPSEWFEEALASLAAQDYPALVVLVVDAGSAEPIVGRVAGVLPNAYVHRIDDDPGFSTVANAATAMVEGSDFFLFCHDDIALDPDAVRQLVEEAFRSNAGIVGPKLVAWDVPDELLSVGLSADKTGVTSSFVTRAERDQEQHDAVRDVFCIPGGATLVRADLLRALDGYDEGIPFLGEDLDLCWRAQVAGARVMVVPAARARHREALDTRRPFDDRRRLLARHRLRTTLVAYGWFHLLRVLPQAALFAVGEAMVAVATGDFEHAREVLGAWPWNLRRRGDIRARRRQLARVRALPDAEVRRLQVHGSARVSAYLAGELGRSRSLGQIGVFRRRVSTRLASQSLRWTLVAWVAVGAVVLVGSRQLVGGGLPEVGGFVGFPDGPTTLLREYVNGWTAAGVPAASAAPTGMALVGLAGSVAVGAMGLVRQVAMLGLLPIGLVGIWRLAKPFDSRAARAVTLVVYASIALPYDAVGQGRWGTLVLYGATPWLLARLLRAAGDLPFVPAEDDVVRVGWRRTQPVLALGLVAAVTAAFVPVVVVVLPVLGLALSIGSLLVGGEGRRHTWRPLLYGLAASVVAVVANLPWALTVAQGSGWWTWVGVSAPTDVRFGLSALMRFDTGPVAVGLLGCSAAVAGLLPLVIGDGWRLRWAVRLWCVALAGWAVAWVAGNGVLGSAAPDAALALAPVAASLALATGIGVVAFEEDLRRAHFGLRQVVSVIAAAAVVVGTVPVLAASFNGRWHLPRADATASLSFLDQGEPSAQGDYRVLWVGSARILPLSGVAIEGDLAAAVAESSSPAVGERWSPGDESAAARATTTVRLTADGLTQRSGAELADLGIRYVVLAQRAAPTGTAELVRLPPALLTNIDQQLDLRRVAVDPAVVVYENLAWQAGVGTEDPPGSGLGSRRAVVAVQVMVWVGLMVVVVRGRRRRERRR